MEGRDRLRELLLEEFQDVIHPDQCAERSLRAVDKFVEETGTSELKEGDRVILRHSIDKGKGSMTEKECGLVESIEGIEVGKDFGYIREYVGEKIVRINTTNRGDWAFHVDDLEKAP